MKVFQMHTKQRLPVSLEKAWDFFSDPGNLPYLTPDWMHFTITSQPKGGMYPGMIATYHLRPLLHVKLTWVTEITHVKDQEYFIDEQRFGPYRFWHHEHHFKEIEGGVEMTDILHYALPAGIIGQAVHAFSVEKKLQEVFRFRYQTLEKQFGTLSEG